jgi:diamine N-acetyltransferase
MGGSMAKRTILPIENDRIRLRLLEAQDLPMTLAWRNQDQIRRWFLNSETISMEQHQRWYDQYSQRDDDFIFIIEEIRDLRKPVGQISIYKIDWLERCAEFGRLLIGEPSAREKSIAKEATSLILDVAFKTLKLNRIELEVYCNNEPALAIYRQCGFYEQSTLDGVTKMIRINDFMF